MMKLRNTLLFLLLLTFPVCNLARAEELAVYAGEMVHNPGEKVKRINWEADYRYNLNKYASFSIAVINEGHFTGHARDGFAGQFWGNLPFFNQHAVFSLGAGLYQYYDTVENADLIFVDNHGLGVVYSASLTYYPNCPWFARLIYNRINPFKGLSLSNIMLGIGYRLPEAIDYSIAGKTDFETTVLLGPAILSSLDNERGIAAEVELRTGLIKYIDWTVSWLYENIPKLTLKNGAATQIWLADEYFNRHLILGLGAGPYYYSEQKYPQGGELIHKNKLSWIATVTVGYRFTEHWFTRLFWNRVGTSYNRDTDDFLLGVGYSWN